MARKLNIATLDQAAEDYAGQFLLPSTWSRSSPKVATGGRDWVLQNFFNATFRDEFDYLSEAIGEFLGVKALQIFDEEAKKRFIPRSDKVFEKLLAEKLAIAPSGEHIPGLVGTTQVGGRNVGQRLIEFETLDSIRRRKRLGIAKDEPGQRETIQRLAARNWPVYAGEEEERERIRNDERSYDDKGVSLVDPLPIGGGALNTKISNVLAILGLDALLDGLDEGTGAAIIRGYTTPQATDPDTAIGAQVLLFTLVATDPAFPGAVDDTGKATATASAITDDSSADATDTLDWIRASSTNDGATPLDDHIDGDADTSGADFNFNTLAIVSGATVSMTSWTVSLPEA